MMGRAREEFSFRRGVSVDKKGFDEFHAINRFGVYFFDMSLEGVLLIDDDIEVGSLVGSWKVDVGK